MTMSNRPESGSSHAEPNYVVVFAALAILTAIEVGVTYLPVLRVLVILMLLALAVSKATLVAMYFMHLRFDHRILAGIFATPLLLGSALVFFLLP